MIAQSRVWVRPASRMLRHNDKGLRLLRIEGQERVDNRGS